MIRGIDIRYRDTAGIVRETHIPIYDPRADTVRRSLGRVLMPGTGQPKPGQRRRTRPPKQACPKGEGVAIYP